MRCGWGDVGLAIRCGEGAGRVCEMKFLSWNVRGLGGGEEEGSVVFGGRKTTSYSLFTRN
jgi:hypothetical protein